MYFLHLILVLFSNSVMAGYVTSQFKGQLGNQMFEVASVMAYALDHGYEVSFPTIFEAIRGEDNYRHVFHRLNISPFPEGTEFYLHVHDKLTDPHIYAPIPFFQNQNVKIEGHCVSENYFERHSDLIRNLFEPSREILNEIYAKYAFLLKKQTVAIHVRTFIPDNFLTKCHTPFGLEFAKWDYYIKAMKYFSSDCQFLVFSDDTKWTKKHFPIKNKNITFIEGNPPYFDLYFISLCDHQIISPDSTFSWWGAWLNKNPNKIVIAPDEWWGLKVHDSIPKKWVRIPRFAR